MECTHPDTMTPEFINDALKTLRTLQKVSDNMMADNCDVAFLDIIYLACRDILNQVCPREVRHLHPHLMEDKDFKDFIEHIIHHADSKVEAGN